MDWLTKYLPVYQVADAASGDNGAEAPAIAAEQAIAEAVAAEPEAAPDAAPEVVEPVPPVKPRSADPLISTISGLRGANRELQAEVERARREAADARALAERLSRGDQAT